MASNSIISKIENNLDLYFELKKQLDKLPKWSDPGSFDNINDAAVKYTYFIFCPICPDTSYYSTCL